MIKLTHWRGQKLDDMTRPQLQDALADAYDLYRKACDNRISLISKSAEQKFLALRQSRRWWWWGKNR